MRTGQKKRVSEREKDPVRIAAASRFVDFGSLSGLGCQRGATFADNWERRNSQMGKSGSSGGSGNYG
jgi:hypothetical protein